MCNLEVNAVKSDDSPQQIPIQNFSFHLVSRRLAATFGSRRYRVTLHPNNPKYRFGMSKNLLQFLTTFEHTERFKCMLTSDPGEGKQALELGTFLDDFYVDGKTAKMIVEHIRRRSNAKCDDDLAQTWTAPLVLENRRLNDLVKDLERRLADCRSSLEAEERGREGLKREIQQYKCTRQQCRYF